MDTPNRLTSPADLHNILKVARCRFHPVRKVSREKIRLIYKYRSLIFLESVAMLGQLGDTCVGRSILGSFIFTVIQNGSHHTYITCAST